jgi:hypothetical protein
MRFRGRRRAAARLRKDDDGCPATLASPGLSARRAMIGGGAEICAHTFGALVRPAERPANGAPLSDVGKERDGGNQDVGRRFEHGLD